MNRYKNKMLIVSIALSVVANLIPSMAWASLISCSFPGVCNVDVNQQAADVMQTMEDRYGLSSDTWRNAQRKVTAPKVEVLFDNTNPKPGEKVTAHAIPEFFKNDTQNLYYTWYIIHTTDGRIQTATNSIKDGKLEAEKIMSHGDYDPGLDGQTYADPSKDPDKDGWPAVDSNSFDANTTAAPMGGADGVGGLPEGSANIEPFSTSGGYCDSRGNHTISGCSLNTNKSSFNQYYNFQSSQTGDFCKACQASLSFTSTISPTGNPVGIASPNNQCCYSIQYPGQDPTDPGATPPYDSNISYCPTSYNAAYESCFDYSGLQTYNSNLITSCLDTQYQTCKDNWDVLHANPSGNEPVGKVSRCYKHNFGTNNPGLGFRGYIGSSNSFSSDDSGTDIVTDCVHKWEDAPGYTSGSGEFTTGEEEYWKTDPTDPDTDGDGFPDGADVIGLGQENFTWNYQAGDRVGVVVEGTSMIPVDEKSAYYKLMWGYLDVCDSSKKDLMDKDQCEDSDDFGYGFLATVSPNEQGNDKLKISLSATPDNPLADPSSDNKDNILSDGTISNADQISVISSLDNTNLNPNDLYYTWQIQKGDPQKNDWGNALDIKSDFDTASPSSGMGISEFDFTPKKEALSGSGDTTSFKVTLTASKASDLKADSGRSSVIITVNKKGVRISLYKVDIKDGKAVVGDEICTDGLYKSLCPAVKGQMLAAKVTGSNYSSGDSQFSWTLDGEALYPPANATDLFSGWSNTTVFFPITKEEQQIENLTVTATSKGQLQPATGSRLATVVHPAVFIKSSDTSVSQPKVYAAQDNTAISSYRTIQSSNAFEAITNSRPSYYLDFVPYYLLSSDANTKINWSINGTDFFDPAFYSNNPNLGKVDLGSDGQSITFSAGANEGDFTTLSAEVQKYWSSDERSIPYTAWGVAPDTLSGKSTATIEAVNAPVSLDYTASTGNPGQILAAIGTHLPHYFMYLLRLVLTLAVMFAVSAGFYGVSQNLRLFDEKK